MVISMAHPLKGSNTHHPLSPPPQKKRTLMETSIGLWRKRKTDKSWELRRLMIKSRYVATI